VNFPREICSEFPEIMFLTTSQTIAIATNTSRIINRVATIVDKPLVLQLFTPLTIDN
jgi:hypothetical protein